MKKSSLILFGSVILSAGSFSFLSGGEFAANTNIHPYFAPPAKLHGKTLWNNVGMGRYPEELSEIAKEPMTQSNYWKMPAGSFRNFFENPPPDNIRLMVREILIFSGKKNMAISAGVTAAAPFGEIRYPERVNDGDDSRQSTSYSAPALMKKNQPGSYTFTFAKPVKIDSVIIKSGRERSEENGTYVHLAADFSIQIKDKSGKWVKIKGTDIKGNTLPERKVTFAPVTVKEVKVDITGQGTLMKRTPSVFTKYTAPKDIPFQVTTLINRPPFNCFEDSILTEEDLKKYQHWRDSHPNFMGFYIGEWDNDIMHIYYGRKNVEKLAKRFASSPTIRRSFHKMAEMMKTREGFMKALKYYFDCIAESHFRDPAKLNFIDCCRAFSHYAQEWGAKYCIMETTCNGYQRHQPQMYFTRGAARQYGNGWGWYIAPTLLGKKPPHARVPYTDPDYTGKWSLNDAGSKGGFSPSMNKRDRYLAFLTGATTIWNEVWPHAYCMPDGNKKAWKLSPHGEVMKEWFDFVTKNPDRGVSYAPIAIGMQWDHGVSPIVGAHPFAEGYPNMRGDMMNEAVLRTFVPSKMGLGDQDWGMSETPYGDICDVILPAPPSGPVGMNVLKNYRVLFLSGKFDPDKKLAARLQEYVKNGGTLVINVKQLGKNLKSSFTGIKTTGKNMDVLSPVLDGKNKKVFALKKPCSFEIVSVDNADILLKDSAGNILLTRKKYGKGHVLACTVDHMIHKEKEPMRNPFYGAWKRDLRFPFMDYLFRRLSDELLPVKVKGHIQYGLNIRKNGMWVYLFNNEGVKKTAFTAQTLDESKKAEVAVNFKKLSVSSVKELRSGKVYKVNKDNTVEVIVPPGDVAVLEIVCRGLK